MNTTTIKITNGSDVYTMTANFADASSPIMLDGASTPFQVADARHSPANAVDLVMDWCDGVAEGDEYEWEDAEEIEIEIPDALPDHCSGCGAPVDERHGWTNCTGGGPECGDRCPECGPHTH